tara:strand:+ start:144 stop:1370 length:1227 start_codon:yes stop_codon:yes gene_type:complete
MAMKLATGAQQQFWGVLEATTAFDTVVKPVAADAMPLLNLDINPTKDFHKVMERTGTGSLKKEVAGQHGGTWSATFYVKPEGTTTNAEPDVGAIFTAAFGAVGTSGDVSYTNYTGSGENFEPRSLQFHKRAGAHHYEVISGCWVEQLEFSVTANEIPTVTATGGFSSYGFAFGATLNGAGSTSNAYVTVDAGQAQRFRAGSYIQFNEGGTARNNSGNFYKVTSIDTTNHRVNISPNPEQALDDDTTIEAAPHSQTLTSNNPVDAVGSALTLGGNEVGFISASVTFATGITGRREGHQGQPTGLTGGVREVTGTLNCYMNATDVAGITTTESFGDISRIIGDAWNGNVLAAVIRAGANTSKERMKINLPAIRPNVTAVEIPEAEAATCNITFTARVGSTNGDEISIDFD